MTAQPHNTYPAYEQPLYGGYVSPGMQADAMIGMSNHELAQQNLWSYQVESGGASVIDLQNAQDIEGPSGHGLVGTLVLGDRAAVKVYAEQLSDSRGFHQEFVLLTHADYDPTNVDDQRYVILRNNHHTPSTLGREQRSAHRLGLTDMDISRRHLQIWLSDGRLNVTDLESANGTRLISVPQNVEQPLDRQPYVEQHAVDFGAPVVQQETRVFSSRERVIDGISFSVGTKFAYNGFEAYGIISTDGSGRQRRFMVYRSNSDGGLRVSQGIEKSEKGHRLLKGAEGGHESKSQYTQDTKLHPEFISLIETAVAAGGLSEISHDFFNIDDTGAELARQDFEDEIHTFELPNRRLARELDKVDAGDLSVERLAIQLGVRENKVEKKLMGYVESLNDALRKSGMIPDFNNPVHIENDSHPILGSIRKEIYHHNVDGQIHEWHMAYDAKGRVWIDRIRFANAEASPYGSDKQLVDSGILTSKPLDYLASDNGKSQVSGIPAELQSIVLGHYADITPFLAKLEPIKRFRAQKGFL
ncbi:MAG TPA: FHA domain-containing protein [Candidatus Saccharimonadales bacterium]|nr:FHA domain-containing protein [Candidatus Saccharimonadales bacterium]